MIYSDDPTYGAGVPFIRSVTGASERTARRWKADPARMPEAAARLVRFAVWGDLDNIAGETWAEFKLLRGKLYAPLFRDGFTPEQIKGMFFELQELRYLRREVAQLREQLAALESLHRTLRAARDAVRAGG